MSGAQSVETDHILLDLFCCAGGAGTGYERAGFRVFSVDIYPQPRNPHPFHQGDAIGVLDDLASGKGVLFARPNGGTVELFEEQIAAKHGSPPCQAYTPLGALHPHKTYPDLIDATRDRFEAMSGPWVIENVMAAPLRKDRSITLCGGMFGLRTYRHRRFESNVALAAPDHPKHVIRTATKQRRKLWDEGWHVSITGDVGTYVGPEAMGIDWMSGNELSEAIPPPYTDLIGRQVIAHIEAMEAPA